MTVEPSTVGCRDALNGDHHAQPSASTPEPGLDVILNGVRGGQGTSTVAAALAVYLAGHTDTQLVVIDPTETTALLGVATGGPANRQAGYEITDRLAIVTKPSDSTGTIRVHDRRSDPASAVACVRLAVLRGPCYLSVRALVASQTPPDGIVLLAEPGRSLTSRDVADVTGVPVVAAVPVNPAVARTIDAGLLLARLHRLRELEPLRRYAIDLLERTHVAARTRPDHPTHDLNDRATRTIDTNGTELPVAHPQPAELAWTASRETRKRVG